MKSPIVSAALFNQLRLIILILLLTSCKVQTSSSVNSSLLPTLSIADSTALEGETVNFTVTLSQPAAETVTLQYETQELSSAVEGTDYTATSGTLTIQAGEEVGSISVLTTEDTLDEHDEVFKLVITEASNINIDTFEARGTIQDDDSFPSVGIDDVSQAEGSPLVFTVSLSTASGRDTTLTASLTDLTSSSGSDYSPFSTTTVTINEGNTSATITINSLDDSIDEIDETFTLVLSDPQYLTISDGSGLGTITDNDAEPTINVSDVTATEGTNPITLTVSLSGGVVSGKDITFDWASSDGTATSPADYTSGSGTSVLLPAGSNSVDIELNSINDTLTESTETITATLSNVNNAADGTLVGTVSLEDDDVIPTVSISDATISEGDQLTFTVSISETSGLDVSVDWATANGTAVAGTDYTAASSSATIPAGNTSVVVNVSTLEDVFDEDDETLQVTISNPTNASLGDTVGDGSITDDDPLPNISVADLTVNENDGIVNVVVTIDQSNRDVTFDWSTADNTATTANSDYSPNSGTVTITAGNTTANLPITITNNTTHEASESMFVNLSNPVNGTIADSQSVVTINDDDSAPTISINDITITEGQDAVFTLTRTGLTDLDATVNFTTSNGTALSPGDYTLNSGTVTFTANAAPTDTETVTITTIDDSTDEPQQTFNIDLSGATNSSISDAQGESTINDNDALVSVSSISDPTVTEGTDLTFTVTLSAASEQTVTLDYTTSDASAEAGSDYTAASGTLTINAGDTTGDITVSTSDDSVKETSETMTLTLSNPGNATLSDSSATGTLSDNEATPVITIANNSVAENSVATLTITSSLESADDITVDWATSDGTATDVNDYTAASGTATISAGNTTTTINVSTVDNTAYEISETFSVTLSNPSGATIGGGGVATVTITDSDTAPTLAVDDVTLAEDDTTMTFTVTRTGLTEVAATFDWATSDGTASNPSDYTANSSTGSVASGGASNTTTFNVTVKEDLNDEPDQDFTVTLSNPGHSTLSDATGTGTITDDDSEPALVVNDVSVSEGLGSATFTVSFAGPTSEKTITVDYATSDGSDGDPLNNAVAPGDYTASSGTVTISPGNTSNTFVVDIDETDTQVERDESYAITLSSPSNATISDASGVGTITNDDTAQISIADVNADEGNDLVFTISIDRTSVNDVTVDWTTVDGVATAGNDFAANSGTATITAGLLSTTVTVVTSGHQEAIYETNETFNVVLSNPSGGVISDNTGVGTIDNEDAAPTLAINDQTTGEGAGTSLTVTRTGATEVDISFDWATANGTALAGSDYTTTSATGITIPAGNSDVTLALITPTDDLADEVDEVFYVVLSNPNAATISDGTGDITITDNDNVPDISIDDLTVYEQDGNMTFTVTLSSTSGKNVQVDYASADVTGSAGSDYTSTSGTLTITPGNTTGTIVVPVTDDTDRCEGSETFQMNLSNPSNGSITDAQGIGTIQDNDPSISVSNVSNAESSNATFTVNLSGTCGSDVTIDYATSDTTASSATDYTSTSGTLTILSGNTSGNIVVPVNDDALTELSETFVLTLSNASNAFIPGSTVALPATLTPTGTITDNDSVNISVNDPAASADENGNITFTISLSAVAGSNVTVDYATVGTTATAGSDFTHTAGTATVLAGNTFTTVNVPLLQDTTDESVENFNFNISNNNIGSITDSSGVGEITDDDAQPIITISDVTAAENGTFTATVSLDRTSTQNVTFDWSTSDVSALAGTDYTANSGSETILAGATTKDITISVTDDGLYEPTETFQINLSNPGNSSIGDNTSIVSITNDETLPSLTINDITSVSETGSMVFTVSLSGPLSTNVTFDWATSDGTASAGSDYTANSNTGETITAGSTSTTLTINLVGDSDFEGDETFNINISNQTTVSLGDGVGLGTITEDEAQPTISIANASTVTEGTASVFTVSLSAAAAVDITVDFASSDNSANSGSDYTATSGTLTIAAGQNNNTISVTTADDSLFEGSTNESFTMTISNPSKATLGTNTATGELIDNEPKRLNDTLASSGDVQSMKIAADGSKVVFIADLDTDGINELYSVNVDGSGHTKISAALVAGGNVTDFAISSDSSKVVYLADHSTDEKFELFSVNLNGTGWTQISSALAATRDVTSFQISQDASTVVYISDEMTDDEFEVFAVAIGGGSVTGLNDSLVSGGDVINAKITANSSTVVFLADADTDEDFELYSVNISGGADTKVNDTLVSGGDVIDFALTLNSSSVVYLADSDTDEVFELYSTAVSGGGATKINDALVSGGDVTSFAISDDSAKVVYIADLSSDNQFEAYANTVGGSAQVNLNAALASGGDVHSFKISANSSKVVFLADKTTDTVNELYSVNITGGSVTKISSVLVAGGDVSAFVLTADSGTAVYLADQDSNDEIEVYKVALTGGASTQLNATLPTGASLTDITTWNSTKVFYIGDQATLGEEELFITDL